ncbi:pentatricopeptide repeat (PPR) superfamily protein [Artemisia annua]|uniref:Pentatricopeptide repeat (PPR) superfamily protein n=1 Tax=Artemisia annua TaxID=35608 RepID=A0A2U1QN92_ARTAN|nr:pentatricopeptide repeat (PPR) superfamily protein [Artemisia annua]
MISKFKFSQLSLQISRLTKLTESTKHLTVLTNHAKHSTITHVTTPDHLKNQNHNNPFVFSNKLTYPDVYSCTKLIQSHLRNNRFCDALKVFDEMPVRDSVTWNSMLKGCFDCGNLDVGFELFDAMPERNVVSWTTVVNGLLRYGSVEGAERLFNEMPVKDEAAWNAMIYGYFVNGRVEDGVRLFGEMPVKSVVSWTAMISGLDQAGKSDEALVMFKKMLGCGVWPTAVTFTSVITACVNVKDLCLGVVIHGHVVKRGYFLDAYIVVPLITLYAHCKDIDSCCKVFNETSHKSVAVWTSLLTGYCLNCKYDKALEVFAEMFRSGVLPNQSSFTSALNSCCELEALDKGKEINGVVIKLGFESDAFVGNSLVVLYTKCGSIDDGLSVFKEISEKNIVSWNSMIVGCAQHGYGMWALVLFNQMMRYGVPPDDITFTGLLSACSRSGMLDKGKCIFDFLSHRGSVTMKLEHYACMVDILGLWTSLLTGYCSNCKYEKALEVFRDMFRFDVLPNQSSFTSALNSCCELEALDKGNEINGVVIKLGFESDAFVGNSLVVLYTKCGNINDGLSVFKEIADKNIVSWNSMIVGCAQHGYGMWALVLFNQMMRFGVPPDDITFTGLLSACSRSGMLDKGKCIFEFLLHYGSVTVKLEHYACMVDILGRKGKLKEAEELVKSMPMEPNRSIWLSLLSACKMHSNIKLAERAAEAIFAIDHDCSAAYTLLSSLYASSGRWNDASRIQGGIASWMSRGSLVWDLYQVIWLLLCELPPRREPTSISMRSLTYPIDTMVHAMHIYVKQPSDMDTLFGFCGQSDFGILSRTRWEMLGYLTVHYISLIESYDVIFNPKRFSLTNDDIQNEAYYLRFGRMEEFVKIYLLNPVKGAHFVPPSMVPEPKGTLLFHHKAVNLHKGNVAYGLLRHWGKIGHHVTIMMKKTKARTRDEGEKTDDYVNDPLVTFEAGKTFGGACIFYFIEFARKNRYKAVNLHKGNVAYGLLRHWGKIGHHVTIIMKKTKARTRDEGEKTGGYANAHLVTFEAGKILGRAVCMFSSKVKTCRVVTVTIIDLKASSMKITFSY